MPDNIQLSSGPRPERAVILIVEDEDMVRWAVTEFLASRGFDVLEAADADGALSTLAAGGAVDLVFSDVRMPGKMDGFGLARWVRSHRPGVPVLLTSGYFTRPGTFDRDDAPPLLDKPYSFAELEKRIQAMI